MLRRLPFFVLLCITVVATGCLFPQDGDSGPAGDCDLDVNNLSGTWISMKGGGGGKDVPDPFARAKFFVEDGKKKAIYTAGQISPGNPATNKYTYDLKEITEAGEALYSINMFPDKSTQRLERLKKDNRRLDVKFEGRLYVKVDLKRCALTLGDFYVTYNKGEETVDSNPTGTRGYLRSKEELGFVHCDEVRQLYAFEMEKPNWDKDKALNPKEGIFAEEPVWLHYAEKNFEGSKEEVEKKLVEAGVKAAEGCSYDFDLWVRDRRAEGAQKVAVTPMENGFVAWKTQYSFPKSSADGLFVELHRYKTCADGKRALIGNACMVAWPEPARTEAEKAEAENETEKK